jgi:polyhydroxyalkanoate synthesis regulator phasin
MPDDIHKRLKAIAKEKHISVTALINSVMGDYTGMYTDPGFIDEFRKRIEILEREVKELKEKK